MSAKRQSRDWKAIYQEYCASGLSVEQFGKRIGVSGSWVTENFRRLARTGEIIYPLPKESPAGEPAFLPLNLTDPSGTAADIGPVVLKVTIGKVVIEIPAEYSTEILRSVLRIACEIC